LRNLHIIQKEKPAWRFSARRANWRSASIQYLTHKLPAHTVVVMRMAMLVALEHEI
jgi:hypothetical protein